MRRGGAGRLLAVGRMMLRELLAVQLLLAAECGAGKHGAGGRGEVEGRGLVGPAGLASAIPAQPLQPVSLWHWNPVGAGWLYSFPLSLSPAPATPPRELPPQPPSLSSWLQAQLQAGNITADREQLLLSLAAAVKTVTGTR